MNSKEHNHSHHDHDHDHAHSHLPSDPELRVTAIETLLLSKGLIDPNTLDELIDTYENNIGPKNGLRLLLRHGLMRIIKRDFWRMQHQLLEN